MKPQTVNNYLSHLSSVFSIARPAWGFPLNKQAMDDAQKDMKSLGITRKSTERDRRPTLAELDKLSEALVRRVMKMIDARRTR
jgi:hypothetical protein